MVPRTVGAARTLLIRGLAAWALALAAGAAQAESLRFCDADRSLAIEAQDRLLRVTAVVREQLAKAPSRAALIARSGQDLSRFGQRYSHAGVSLAASANTPWSVRQLYFACDEGAPRLYDQGLAGFVMGIANPARGFVSIVLLPPDAATALEARALDNRHALQLLGASYSANAHAFSTRHQNCNQWLIELLASAWGGLPSGEGLRERAQEWLRSQAYEPTRFELGSGLWRLVAAFVPWLNEDDHPREDLDAPRYRVSMPESIEAFVRRTVPQAERIEICHDERQIVIRRGWQPLAADCRAEAGDQVLGLS